LNARRWSPRRRLRRVNRRLRPREPPMPSPRLPRTTRGRRNGPTYSPSSTPTGEQCYQIPSNTQIPPEYHPNTNQHPLSITHRAAFATAQTAEIAKIRQTHDAEIGSLRDALNTSERALESNAKRHRDELAAVTAACESSRRESLSRMETECVERVAAAEAETTRLRASLADVVSQSEACVNDAVASAYAAWRGELLFIFYFHPYHGRLD
jgi:hypothetical protein